MPKKQSLAEIIYLNLKQDLIDRVYQPGQLVTEAEFSEKYHVSKTPVREALGLLCSEDFMEKIPHKGYLVTDVSANDLRNLFQFRRVLEIASALYAIKASSKEDIQRLEDEVNVIHNMNDQQILLHYNELNTSFHLGIAKLSHNPYLVSALTDVLNQMSRVLTLDFQKSKQRELLETHLEILEMIKNQNEKGCIDIISQHIVNAQNRINHYGF